MLMLKHRAISIFFIFFSLAYIAQATLVPPDQATLDKYHITEGKLTALVLTIAIPYIIIWFIALIGYLRLRAYTDSIKGSKDGKGFKSITTGMLLLTLWLPLSTLVAGLASQIYTDRPDLTDDMVRLVNYLNLAILFPAFWIINKGSRQLLSLTKASIQSLSPRLTMAYIAFSASYVFLTLNDPARQMPAGGTKTATYYEPDWLIMLTLVIPRLLMWFMGIQAVQNIYLYRRKVKGTIYKTSLRNLAWGIGGVVTASVVLRCIQSLSSHLSDLGLGALFLIVYLLLIIIGIGYVYIARGARDLQKIEEF